MDLFTLVARLGMDSSEYERGISKARGSFNELGTSIGAKAVAIGNMVSRAVEKAVDIAADLGRSAIQNAADVAAEKAQFKAAFKELEGEANAAFKAIEKSTGVFGTRLKNVGTKAFSQFKGAGLDGVDALSMMKDYTELAADAAAYYDISLEDADTRLRSFLRGNTEAGDAIGLFTSESQRNSAAIEKYGQKWQQLNEAQKQMLMLDISKDIYEQSGAIGQAARESDSWTNVLGNLKEIWRQVSSAFGAPILAVISPVLQDVSEWLKKPEVEQKVTQFGLTVANAIKWVLNPTFPTWEEVKAATPGQIEAIIAGVESVANWTLGKFGMPSVETIVTDVQNWWTGQGDNAYERVKSVLSWSFGKWVAPALDVIDKWWNGEGGGEDALLGLLGWTLGEFVAPAIADLITSTGQTVYGWAAEFIKGVIALLDWTLGELNLPTASSVINQIQSWWAGIRDSLNLWFSATFSINKKIKDSPDPGTWEEPYVGIGEYDNGWNNGYDTGIQNNAGGMFYTRNNYVSRLHEGEAILNSREAAEWRAGKSGNNSASAADIAAAVAQALDGAFVDMDSEHVGQLVLPTVSRGMARDANIRRYSFG